MDIKDFNDEKLLAVVKTAILEVMSARIDEDDIKPETELFDLKLRDVRRGEKSSHLICHIVNLVEVINELDTEFSLETEMDDLYDLWTVADIINCLKKVK